MAVLRHHPTWPASTEESLNTHVGHASGSDMGASTLPVPTHPTGLFASTRTSLAGDAEPLLEPDSSVELRAMASNTYSSTELIDESDKDVASGLLAGDAEHPGVPKFTYRPTDPPKGFPPSTFRPTILKSAVTIAIIVLYVAIIGGMLSVLLCTDKSRSYSIVNVNVYFCARYGPSLVGVITTTLVRSTLQEIRHMLPYINMSDPHPGKVVAGLALESVASQYFSSLYWMTWTADAIVVLQLLTTPLTAAKARLLQVIAQQQGWTIIVHQLSVWLLVAYYAIQRLLLLYVTVKLYGRSTGLREGWDPTNIADTIAMFQYFNLDVGSVPYSLSPFYTAMLLGRLSHRLGYWVRISDGNEEVVYGIRAIGSHRTIRPRLERTLHAKLQAAEASDQRRSGSPYTYLPVISGSMWGLGCVLGGVLVAALVVVVSTGLTARIFSVAPNSTFSLVDSTVQFEDVSSPNLTASGDWSWLNGSSPDIVNLGWWNVLLRQLPIFVASFVLNIALAFDRYHLYCQPLTDMYLGPNTAEQTILLDYQTVSSFAVLLQAWKYSHWRVFYFSTLAMLAPILQLVPVGVLSLTSKDQSIYGRFSPGFVAVQIVVLTIYISSYITGHRCATRHLPRLGTSLIDMRMLCHSSLLARSPEFAECRPGWTKQDLAATLQLRHDKYLLGQCASGDGAQRIGFDVASLDRKAQRVETVRYVDPKAPARTAHCARCLADARFHEQSAQRDEEALWLEHYTDYVEPVARPRGFERGGSARESMQDVRALSARD